MKKGIFTVLVVLLMVNLLYGRPSENKYKFSFSHLDFPTYVILDYNNIKAYFWTCGIFDQNMNLQNAAGFYWPKGSTNTACFTAGLSIAGKINGQLAQTVCSYKGEYTPGYILNQVAYTSNDFKFYSVKRGDSINTNPDYANWYKMVPYGAPYIDVNNNGVYDQGIDVPGLSYATQTIYACLTDGFANSHNNGEGFGGGVTNPLMMSELHFTAFTYNDTVLDDMQFIRFEIVNKGSANWDSTYFSIFADPDIGYPFDDYIGCDTNRSMGYAYNGNDNDPYYGAHPPAFGIRVLQGPYVSAGDTLKMTSFNYFTNSMSGWIPCEVEPNGEPLGAYTYMRGFKKDGTPYLNPTIPLGQGTRKTKFCFSGDPETNTGWVVPKGSFRNCSGDTTGILDTLGPTDVKFLLSTGKGGFTVHPGQKKTLYVAQLIARGTSNLNSVTKLKEYSDLIYNIFQNNIKPFETSISPTTVLPERFYLGQNYPNPFNPVTTITYDLPISTYVDIRLYDITGKEIQRLVNERQTAGTYKITFDASELPSGIYFYRMTTPTFTESKKMVLVK
jgi:hypothetical protein